jgi:hypothetical protein
MVDRWMLGIDEAQRVELGRHLAACPACREEAEALDSLWSGLGSLPVEEPGRNLRLGFYHMMEAYRLGAAQAGMVAQTVARKPSAARRVLDWLHQSWPKQPLVQVAMAGLAMVIGVLAGTFYTTRQHDRNTISQLNTEVHQMRQLVALSLLQQQSASDRLRGVSWSVQVEPADNEVLGALLQTLNTDSNVNVRLAAVDALKQFSTRSPVRRGMREAILRQDSPLVQIALIDWAVESKDRAAVDVLERLKQQPELNQAVQVRVANALARLSGNSSENPKEQMR